MKLSILVRGHLWGAVAGLLVLSAVADAQQGSWRSSRDSREVLATLDPVTIVASRSVCVLSSGRRECALGTVIRADGWILSKASELRLPLIAKFSDGRKLQCSLRAMDRRHDLALLKVEAEDLHPIQWRSEGSSVGELVVAASFRANALGMGVVSGQVRALEAGNPMLGVNLYQGEGKARIESIVEGTAAQAIGLRTEDIITTVGKVEVAGNRQLVEQLRSFEVGDDVDLVVLRNGRELLFSATLGTWDDENPMEGRKNQVRSGFPKVFRHDCILKPSECGGPLVDLDGKVLGLNIARSGRTASYAIPAKTVQEVAAKLFEEVSRERLAQSQTDYDD